MKARWPKYWSFIALSYLPLICAETGLEDENVWPRGWKKQAALRSVS